MRLSDGALMAITRHTLLLSFFFSLTPLFQAQEHTGRVAIAGENDQILLRLLAADHLVAWGNAPDVAARTVGQFALPSGLDRVLAPCLALAIDNNSQENWDRALGEYQRLLAEVTD